MHTTYEGHKNHIHAFKVSADYRYIVSASADFTIKLWDTKTHKCMRTFEGHAKAVRDVDIIPGFNFADENRLILSASSDKTLRLWDARSDGAKKVRFSLVRGDRCCPLHSTSLHPPLTLILTPPCRCSRATRT